MSLWKSISGFLISMKINIGEFMAKEVALPKTPFVISKIPRKDGLLIIF